MSLSGTSTVSRSGSSAEPVLQERVQAPRFRTCSWSVRVFLVTLARLVPAATANVSINGLVTTSYDGRSWSVTQQQMAKWELSPIQYHTSNVDLCSCTKILS
jgi:hypothetical protein